MSDQKMCRLWCPHDEYTDDADGFYCADCYCLMVPDGTGLEPDARSEGECECPDCRRDFWGQHTRRLVGLPDEVPKLPALPSMPLRDWLRLALSSADAQVTELWGLLAEVLAQDPFLSSPGAMLLRKRQRHAMVQLRTAREKWTAGLHLASEITDLEAELHQSRRINAAYAQSPLNPAIEQNLTAAVIKAREAQAAAERALEDMTRERDLAQDALAEIQGAGRDC